MTARRLLLVSPAFHGYWSSIATAFSRLGYEVHTHRYDSVDSVPAKLRMKLGHELPERLGRDRTMARHATMTGAAVAAVRTVGPDVVLVVKGDLLGPDFWEVVSTRVPRSSLWLYDELRRTRITDAMLTAVGSVASYSRIDVDTLRERGYSATFVPLAYDQHLQVRPRPGDDVVFVGARYPKREQTLEHLHRSGVPVRAYGRDWSGHPIDRARTWRLSSSAVPGGRDLGRADAYAVMAGATASLNIHGDQDGFTMRTFECGGIGAVQLIDRSDVDQFYDPETEVCAYSTLDEAVEAAKRAQRDHPWAQSLRKAARARTLAEHTFEHRARALEAQWD